MKTTCTESNEEQSRKLNPDTFILNVYINCGDCWKIKGEDFALFKQKSNIA